MLARIMSQLLALVLFISSCIPSWFKPLDSDEKAPTYQQLKIDYQLVFEKQMFFDDIAQKKLLQDIDRAFVAGTIPKQHRNEVRHWQHKVQAYMWSAIRANVLNENKTFKETISSLIVDRIRQELVASVDFDQSPPPMSAEEFLKAVATEQNHYLVSKQWQDVAIKKHDKDTFFRALIAELIKMAEFSLRKYHYLYPFEKTDPRSFCGKDKECRRLSLTDNNDKFDPIWVVPFTTAQLLTNKTNSTIVLLNHMMTSLQKLGATKDLIIPVFKEIDMENRRVKRLYSFYDIILLNSARSGILPIFLSKSFRKHSGEIFINKVGFLKIKYPLLAETTETIIRQAIVDLKKRVVERWLELKEISASNKLRSPKKIYQWLANNEVATARLVIQDLRYVGLVSDLLAKYQDKSLDPIALRVLRGSLTAVEVGGFLVYFASMTPFLSAKVGAVAIIVATAANFGWVGVNSLHSIMFRNRYLKLEKALLTDSSRRVSDSLELLREFKSVRRKAIISGAIGLPLSIPAMKYVIRDMQTGKAFWIDMVASFTADAGGISQLINGIDDLTDNDILIGR